MNNLDAIIDLLTVAALETANATRASLRRIHELETGLNRMVLAHENLSADTEGKYPPLDAGCLECTYGTVPNRLSTGPCAYHAAKQLLGQS